LKSLLLVKIHKNLLPIMMLCFQAHVHVSEPSKLFSATCFQFIRKANKTACLSKSIYYPKASLGKKFSFYKRLAF